MQYTHVGLGGTFDHFHAGHQAFLLEIAQHAGYLLIGITTESLHHTKVLTEQLEPYEVRAAAVRAFCQSHRIPCEIFPLADLYGPTLSDLRIEAVFVTPETEAGGKEINSKRQEVGLPELPIEVVSLVPAADGRPISSRRIRMGEISRKGIVYAQTFTSEIILNHTQRHFFTQLHGRIVSEPRSSYNRVFSCIVGDSSFETFMSQNLHFSVAVLDYKKQRIPYQPSSEIIKKITATVPNPAGHITPDFVQVFIQELQLYAAGQSSRIIKVEGEEDLAAVVAVLLLPLGSTIYYGQPHQGMVEVLVTEAIKERFYSILS